MGKRNVTIDTRQLSLWDDPVPEQAPVIEDQAFVTGPNGEQLPAVVWHSHSYANGDVSPRALEQLALSTLLDTTICYWGPPVDTIPEKDQWKREYGHSLPGYERYRYRCVATGIIGTQVWGAYVYESCLVDLNKKIDMSPEGEDDL